MVRFFKAFVLSSAGAVAACGETTFTPFQGSADGPPLSVSYLIEGGAADELLSLAVTIEDIRLLTDGNVAAGADGTGSLVAPVRVELLGLERRARLITTRFYGDGRYTHVRVEFGTQGPLARWHDGQGVEWAGDTPRSVSIELEEPFVAVRESALAASLVLRIDPAESITWPGPISPPWLAGDAGAVFQPRLRARVLGAGERLPADDFWGGLLTVSDDASFITLGSESERTIANRAVVAAVLLRPSTLLLQPNGLPAPGPLGLVQQPGLASARFLVRGDHTSDGPGYQAQMVASSIQLDSLIPDNGSDAAIVLEARIVGRPADGRLTVRRIEVERGGEAAQSVLDGLADPAAVDIGLAPSAMVLTATGELGDLDDLRIGMRVKLHFASFSAEPFEATRALVQGRPVHRGVLIEPQPGTSTVLLRLDPGAAAIEGGLVTDVGIPVAVRLNSLFVRLDVEGAALILASQMPHGLRAAVLGRISGPPWLPVIQSGDVVLRPGRFRGTVASVQAQGNSFDASVDSIAAPFGGETAAPPFRVLVADECVFEGAVRGRGAFFERFQRLEPGEALDVEVSGLASGNQNEVIAYQIRSVVR